MLQEEIGIGSFYPYSFGLLCNSCIGTIAVLYHVRNCS